MHTGPTPPGSRPRDFDCTQLKLFINIIITDNIPKLNYIIIATTIPNIQMKIAITGRKEFIDRYHGLISGLQHCGANVIPVVSGEIQEIFWIRLIRKLYRQIGRKSKFDSTNFEKSALAFRIRTNQTQSKLRKLAFKPDIIFHIFGTFCPHNNLPVPFAMLLDYTMKLACNNWPAWTNQSENENKKWIQAEKECYKRAKYLFSFSHLVKRSLVDDYGIDENKIHVVGSGGNFDNIYLGKKLFGSNQILMNATDFNRKGIDLALDAMELLKTNHPSAKLVLLGCDEVVNKTNVLTIKYVHSRKNLEELFLSSDVVLSTARCDPFPGFIIEAMNFGLPPVVSQNGAISEIIQPHINGMILDNTKPSTIAFTISLLLDNSNMIERMSFFARKTVAESLTWPIVSQKIYNIINNT